LELGELSDADVIVDQAELDRALTVPDPNAEANAISRRNVEILRSYAERPPAGRRKRIVLRFLLSPAALVADDHGRVGAVEFVRNELRPDDRGTLRAHAGSERETIQAGLVFRAIGYRGVPLPGVPFDERAGVIPNVDGRVIDPGTGSAVGGEYVVGWIKRGPTGVIGTNKKDAQQTVSAILADLGGTPDGSRERPRRPESSCPEAIEGLLLARQPALVTYAGWSEIDRHERALGVSAGRPRVKLTRIEEMLRVAAAESPADEQLTEVEAH
jgi:ferredoxin--NADP+ reductase